MNLVKSYFTNPREFFTHGVTNKALVLLSPVIILLNSLATSKLQLSLKQDTIFTSLFIAVVFLLVLFLVCKKSKKEIKLTEVVFSYAFAIIPYVVIEIFERFGPSILMIPHEEGKGGLWILAYIIMIGAYIWTFELLLVSVSSLTGVGISKAFTRLILSLVITAVIFATYFTLLEFLI